ncbi:MAG: hypothetical protein ABJH05_08815 [Fulvivirga sp.]
MKLSRNSFLKIALIASLTLGLAPFYPEPHLVGKLRWLYGGGNGMSSTDYIDLIIHGMPWLLLIIALVLRLMPAKK